MVLTSLGHNSLITSSPVRMISESMFRCRRSSSFFNCPLPAKVRLCRILSICSLMSLGSIVGRTVQYMQSRLVLEGVGIYWNLSAKEEPKGLIETRGQGGLMVSVKKK